MKKLILNIGFVVIFIACLLFLATGWGAEVQNIPAPFAKAKEMALKVDPGMQGRYLLFIEQKTANGNSDKTFLIGYLSRFGLIGIGTIEEGDVNVIEYNEESKTFFFYENGLRSPLPPEKAIERAFQIFGEMVSKNLI